MYKRQILPCEVRDDQATFEGHVVALEGPMTQASGAPVLGIRPEHIAVAGNGVPARVTKVSDVGRHFVIEAMVGETPLKAVTHDTAPDQGEEVRLAFRPDKTRVYRDGWIATEART